MLGPLQLSSHRSMPLTLRSFLVNMRLRRILRILSASANSMAFRLPSKDRDTSGCDFGAFRLKWERHTEFCTYTFFHHGLF